MAQCSKCGGSQWLCERHPDKPMDHDEFCEGAGIPCTDCNSLAEDHFWDGSEPMEQALTSDYMFGTFKQEN
jgi:Ni,Fe-hydrogenase I small subunit